MARSGPLLTEAQWKKIAPLLPKPPKQRKGGRPWIENRRVLEGILWILRSGARWQDLPEKFPHPSTCWRRLRDWEERGVWLNIWRAFLSELNERQQLKWSGRRSSTACVGSCVHRFRCPSEKIISLISREIVGFVW